MLEKKILEDNKRIDSIKEFIKYQNNFYGYFLDYCEWGLLKRKKDYFVEFQKKYPKFEKELTEKITYLLKEFGTNILYDTKIFPYGDLFKAYSLITEIIKEKNLDSSYIHLLIK